MNTVPEKKKAELKKANTHPLDTGEWEKIEYNLMIYLWGRRVDLRKTANAKKTAAMLMPFIRDMLASKVEQIEGLRRPLTAHWRESGELQYNAAIDAVIAIIEAEKGNK